MQKRPIQASLGMWWRKPMLSLPNAGIYACLPLVTIYCTSCAKCWRATPGLVLGYTSSWACPGVKKQQRHMCVCVSLWVERESHATHVYFVSWRKAIEKSTNDNFHFSATNVFAVLEKHIVWSTCWALAFRSRNVTTASDSRVKEWCLPICSWLLQLSKPMIRVFNLASPGVILNSMQPYHRRETLQMRNVDQGLFGQPVRRDVWS